MITMINVVAYGGVSILLILLLPILEEFWTLIQTVKSLFSSKIDLKEKYGTWAVVTGCTDGVGKALAFELARRELNIVLISRNLSKLEATSNQIKRKYAVETKIIVADFSQGREIYKEIKEGLKGLDLGILINNVGIQYTYPMYFGELPEQELWDVININVGSVTQMTRIVLPQMVEKNRGAVVNVCSGSKLQPIPFMNLYAASKMFVDYHTDALRHEYRHKNITIQCLCPYYISTKINHFSNALTKINIFIPTPKVYARSAITTLGHIDNTTGYWPHRIQYMFLFLVPKWIKIYFAGIMYKKMRDTYLKKSMSNVEYF
ncbi:hypothetical protein RUM44_004601 [Polyplax serrata]|uniref:Steroid dehydrogenase n=1 Tax=Polyplax serrata TaxID=468196 RepID=A0ABR1B3A8_POLSC